MKLTTKKKDKKRAKIRRKKKSWWDNSLEWLHVKLCKAYQEYRVSGWGNTERREYLESRKQFRAKKRYNIKLKRSQTYKFIEDLFSLNKESFWKRIARMGRSSQRIDMETDKLKLEYEKIFTVSNRSVDDEIADKLKVEEYLSNHSNSIFRRKTDQSLIKAMIGNLSLRKAIGLRGISHEMLKFNCSKKLAAVIARLFDLITNHQIMPDVFNLSVIKPLVKDPKKPSDDIGNIRPVAVSDALSNLFERLILQRINNEHNDHKKQFGFKANSSCNHAAFVLKVAASLTKCRGQRLYACAIDASKAFDKVSRSKLWLKLIEKNLSPDTTIAIIKYYEQSIMLVQITDEFSTPFLAKLGVRQGGVASPKLFSIYIEDLADSIDELRIGIKVDKTIINLMMYADDIIVVSSTKADLQIQLNAIGKYGIEHGIKFNQLKCELLIFHKNRNRSQLQESLDQFQGQVTLNNIPIPEVTSFRYLGIIFSKISIQQLTSLSGDKLPSPC
jgi:hypothetical protein